MARSLKSLMRAIWVLPLLSACAEPLSPVTWELNPVTWAVPPANDTAVPPGARAAYRVDAERLAVRYILATEGEDIARIELPTSLLDDMYRRLVLVHNAATLAARDSVVDVYAIHTFPAPATRELLVTVDKSAPWLAEWHAGRTVTGEPGIDTLVGRFDLEVVRCHVFQAFPYDMCVLRSGRPLVLRALGRLVAAASGVRSAQPNGPIGDGNDIDATREDGGWQLVYSVGWGDCPAGCTGRHTWRFVAADDGRVTFLDSSGPPPPDRRP